MKNAIVAAALCLPSFAAAAEITKDKLDAELAKPGVVFLQVSRHGCPPCDKAAAALSQLTGRRADVRFFSIDANAKPEFSSLGTPTFIWYVNGRESGRQTGFNYKANRGY